MSFDVVMPQMGESIAEATVLKWHRAVGESIGKDETLFEISTDKVDAEIPAPVPGILLEILVPENQTVPVGTIVARIGEAGEKPVIAAAQATVDVATVVATAVTAPVPSPGENLEDRLRTKSSPLVRRMAEAHGVDLRTVTGSGMHGRVTKADMEAYLATPAVAKVSPVAGVVPAPMPAPATAKPAPLPPPTAPVTQPGERVNVEPMSRMRKLIADNMIASKHTSAHTYTVFEIDMTNVAKLRAKHRAAFESAYGTKLSFMPFVMASVAKALRAFPTVNASIEGDTIVTRLDVNLGVAVSLDWGLIVPVVKNADQLNLGGLARALNDLAARARSKQLKPEEIQGGTFTLTNPGSFGDLFGMPVINQPQVAIQAMGAITKRPVVLTDAQGNDSIAIRSIMFSTLSFDHRLIDGALADQFMALVKHELETSSFGLA